MEEKTPGRAEKIRQNRTDRRPKVVSRIELDEKDRRILNILSDNARAKLTYIARHVQLSIDSVKKRIEKLERSGVITKYTIQPNPGALGYGLGVHVYIKLKGVTQERYDELIAYLKKDTRIIDLMSMAGDYDLYIVMLAKNTQEMDRMKMEIRQKFTDLVDDWKEVIVTNIYKLEEYKF